MKKKIFISFIFSLVFSILPFFLFKFNVEQHEQIKEIFQQKIYEEFYDLPGNEYYDIYDSKSKICYDVLLKKYKI